MEYKKIKICHITSVELTIRFILFNKLNFLKNQGYDVSVVCSPGKWIENIKKHGIQVKTVRFKRKFSPFSDLIAFIKLYFYFRKEKFDIVHTHTLKPEFLGQIAAKLAGVPIIINTNHGFYFAEDTPFLKRKFFIFLEKIAANCSDLIFSVSRLLIKTAIKEKICQPDLIKYLGRDIESNKLDPRRFSPEFILNKKRELGIDLNKKVIGIVARLVEEKGYLELFKAFRAILNQFPDTTLLVIGPEEAEKRDAIDPNIVKSYNIQNNVIFLGERSDVDELYSLMDIFVLPSHREGIGASILEASSMERPIITAKIGGLPESIEHGKTGILIPLKDTEKLIESLIYLLSNPEKAREMGIEGRKKILREFNQTLVFARIKTEYQRLIKEKLKLKTIKICHIASVEMTIRFILLNALNFLKNQGYDVSVVCSPGKWIEDIEKHGIKGKTIRFKRKFSPFSDLIAFIKLYFYFRKEKFDIVHTHTLKPEFLGQIAAKLAGVPIIINTNHGFYFAEDTPFLKRKFFIFLEKIAANCSDLIFSVSRSLSQKMAEERICQTNLIRYWGEGVNLSRFNPRRFSPEFILNKKRELGIDLNKKVIGIVARLVEEKGYLELFKAFRAILNQFPDTTLLVIGPEEAEKRDAIDPNIVKRYSIQDNVIFLGERSDVDELYSLMDIFILPTHREGVGLVILEASAMERPVIATNTGGCPEAVDNGKTGILTPLKNVKKLIEAIVYLFNNPEEAKKMGEEGREKVLKEFDEKQIFSRIKTEYQRFIREKLR